MAVIVPPKDPERPIASRGKPGKPGPGREPVQKAKDSSKAGAVPIFGRFGKLSGLKAKLAAFAGRLKLNILKEKTARILAHREFRLLIGVAALALIMGIAGSSITGFVVGPDEVENLTAQLTACQSNSTTLAAENTGLSDSLESYKDLNEQLSDEIDSYSSRLDQKEASLSVCNSDLADSQGDLSSANSLLEDTQDDLAAAQDDLDDIQDDYDTLAQNFANRYCCQLRQLGFNYNAWAVADNNVVCLTSGTKAINCTA